MSSNKTQNYNLHLWEPEDDFVRVEFNENTEAIDGALASLADELGAGDSALAGQLLALESDLEAQIAAAQSELEGEISAVETTLNSSISSVNTTLTNKINSVNTSLTNSINSVNTSLTTAVNDKIALTTGYYTGNGATSRTIALGFQPAAVLVVSSEGITAYKTSGSLVVNGGLAIAGRGSTGLSIASTGFTVAHAGDTAITGVMLNTSGDVYLYLAFH